MVALSPTSAGYVTSGGGEKFSASNGLSNTCRRPDHHHYLTASGTNGGPMMSCSLAAEYGYTHICGGVGGGGGSNAQHYQTAQSATMEHHRQPTTATCDHHRHLRRQCSQSTSSLDQLEEFRNVNGDVIVGTGNASTASIFQAMQQHQLQHRGTTYDMPGFRTTTTSTPSSKPTEYRGGQTGNAPPPPIRRVGISRTGSTGVLDGSSGTADDDDEGQQVLQPLQATIYCQELDLIAAAEQEDRHYWSGVSA